MGGLQTVKLPTDTIIAQAKLRYYLLAWRPRGDKSLWLASAGYTLENWRELERDLRHQLLPREAVLVGTSEYGTMYEIRAKLTGPNGRRLAVRSFWMIATDTGQTRFITMYPDKEGT